jgi:hypothetical protein
VKRPEPPSLTIAMCIPFDIKDVRYTVQCLKSIAHQTRQPDLVVMSFSRIPPPLQCIIQSWLDRFPLACTIQALFSDQQQFAGQNRNLAAAYAAEQGIDIISFIDSDDIAHPRRLECIEQAFLRHENLEAFLHSYKTVYKEPVRDFSKLVWPEIRGRIHKDPFYVVQRSHTPWRIFTKREVVLEDSVTELVQNGHLSIRTSVWKENPYRDDIQIGEDSDYNARLCNKGTRFGLISDKLVLYLYDTTREAYYESIGGKDQLLAEPQKYTWKDVLEHVQFTQEELLRAKLQIVLPLPELIRHQKCVTRQFLEEYFSSEIQESEEVDWTYVDTHIGVPRA